MAQLRQEYQRFVEKNAVIMVVGPEPADRFAEYFEKNDLPFIGLPDPEHTVLKLYGQKVNIFKLGRMPAQMIIDPEGRVRYIHYGHGMADIPKNEEMLALIGP
ncbi:MAG: redoxin domain-containing protein [Spirochaetales bacterium]|nr:redoxin domain-containing protein [Spirochaetales bacterium]